LAWLMFSIWYSLSLYILRIHQRTNTTQICIAIYNNDVYAAHYSASAFAATTFLRFTISSSFPLFAAQMVKNLGFAWAMSLLGFITIAMIPIPWVFFKWGPSLIAKSRYLQN
jgi:hypothetical protein